MSGGKAPKKLREKWEEESNQKLFQKEIKNSSSGSQTKPLYENDILQDLYDKGMIDFEGDEDGLTMQVPTNIIKTGKFVIDVYREGYQKAREINENSIKQVQEKLKKGINEPWTNGEGQCICPECWNKREADEKRVKDCMFLQMFKIIDKIFKERFGEKLT